MLLQREDDRRVNERLDDDAHAAVSSVELLRASVEVRSRRTHTGAIGAELALIRIETP